MRLVLSLFGAAVLLLAALTLTGCAATNVTELVNALAKDNASACVSLNAGLYGDLAACRTNTPGAAIIEAAGGSVKIQHQGAGR